MRLSSKTLEKLQEIINGDSTPVSTPKNETGSAQFTHTQRWRPDRLL